MTALEIRELRNKLELTCEKFAAKLGVTVLVKNSQLSLV
jgi:DNA-binding transcriptional regulator YiaG